MTLPPRIAILTPYAFADFPGGTEVFNEQLAHVFPGLRIFCGQRSQGTSPLHGSLDSIGVDQPRRAWEVSRQFLREHHRAPFDLAICNGLYGWPLSALPQGIPAIQVYHFTFAGLARNGIEQPGVRLHMRFVEGGFDRLSGTGKHIVAVGPNVLDEVRRYYHHDGLVIPNGVDTQLFKKLDRSSSRGELGMQRHARVGLYVGRPEYAKGFDLLRAIVRGSPDTTFLLVGGSPSLGPNTIVHPRVPHSRMPLYFSASDFLLLPSRYEGFNLTILEALACELPLLVSRAAYPLSEPWQDLGVVVDSYDPAAYVEAIKGLPTTLEGASGRERVLAKYSSDRFTQNWRAIVLERMDQGR